MIIGKLFFKAEVFNGIATEYDRLCQSQLEAKEQHGGNNLSREKSNRLVLESPFWDALKGSILGFQEKVEADKQEGEFYKDYLLRLIQALYEYNNINFNRDSFDQLLRKEWIKKNQPADYSPRWVDLFSALNYKYGCFKDDIDKFSRHSICSFYFTTMGETARRIGWSEPMFLYACNLKQLLQFCAVVKCKTSEWVNEVYGKHKESVDRKGIPGTSGTVTIISDITAMLKDADVQWEEHLDDYIEENASLFSEKYVHAEIGVDRNEMRFTTINMKRESLSVEDAIYQALGQNASREEWRICNLPNELHKDLALYGKIFNASSAPNKENLLVYGDCEDYIDDISYLRRLYIIKLCEQNMRMGLTNDYDRTLSDINDELYTVGCLRPIYDYSDGFKRDVFDWYVCQRLKIAGERGV